MSVTLGEMCLRNSNVHILIWIEARRCWTSWLTKKNEGIIFGRSKRSAKRLLRYQD
jgi:hypothetical protein